MQSVDRFQRSDTCACDCNCKYHSPEHLKFNALCNGIVWELVWTRVQILMVLEHWTQLLLLSCSPYLLFSVKRKEGVRERENNCIISSWLSM